MMIPELAKKKPTKKILNQGPKAMMIVPLKAAAKAPDKDNHCKIKADPATNALQISPSKN
ncbi:hypothetical protein P7E30_08485 [Enterococcus gallinarum]|uniref:Uncharacterized protein n=1 Tax=Enterococcus gallinarum TaxID=1353 RepID=A0AAE4HST3_ENTGA|nr:hypothetical protein [Enterococcus gallinarum]